MLAVANKSLAYAFDEVATRNHSTGFCVEAIRKVVHKSSARSTRTNTMNKLVQLQTREREIAARQDAIVADAEKNSGGEFTEEQRTEFDALVAEYATNKTAIAEAQAEAAADAKRISDSKARQPTRVILPSQTARTDAGTPLVSNVRTDDQGRVTGYIEPTDEEITLRFGESPDAVRRQSYRQQQKQNSALLRASGYQPWGEFKSARDFIRTGLNDHTHSSFRDRVGKHYAAVAGMSEGVGSDGGYLLMPELASGIIDRVYKNDLWGRTDNYTVKGNSMTFLANAETSRANGMRHGGLRGYWLGEGATKTPSKPTLRSITLKLVKLAVVVYLTDELLEDTGNVLKEYVERKAGEEFNFMIGDALVNGNGVGQPLGLLNWPSLVSVAKEAGQLADTLETENIIKMFSRFYAPNRSNMIWLHNQDIEPELFTMTLGVGTCGVVTYMPPGGLSSAPYATLMGRPIFPTEFNPTLGDQGDIIAADMGQMLSISKGGIAQAVSIHVEFLSDQTALRFVFRCNAGPWESAPLTPYKGTLTQSNAVTLDARA